MGRRGKGGRRGKSLLMNPAGSIHPLLPVDKTKVGGNSRMPHIRRWGQGSYILKIHGKSQWERGRETQRGGTQLDLLPCLSKKGFSTLSSWQPTGQPLHPATRNLPQHFEGISGSAAVKKKRAINHERKRAINHMRKNMSC